MVESDLLIRAGACIWVIGGSYLMIRYADRIVNLNAKYGWKTDKNTVQRFFGFTMVLGLIGGFLWGIEAA